jgi:lipopolysaccharide export system protein LptC
MSDSEQKDRLKSLNIEPQAVSINRGYSVFVKMMRWGLPIFALVMMVVVIAWPELDEQIEAIPQENILNQKEIAVIGNELLNPKYETTDTNNNPVFVSAAKAIQNQENTDIIRLETPFADFVTEQGDEIQAQAIFGTYDSKNEKLFLQENIQITHANNYILKAQELRLNMKTQEAFSDKDIVIEGQDAHLTARGLEGNMSQGTLLFNGPATLTLHAKQKNISKDSAI